MLHLKTLLNKPFFVKSNGDKVVDLIKRSVSFLGIRVTTGKLYVVDEDSVMRPDLIANYFYQNQGYCDLLLKYNGYSNPFALNIGDILKIPPGETLTKFATINQTNSVDIANTRKKQAAITFKPTTKKDEARLNYLLQRSSTANANLAKLESLLKSGQFTGFNGELPSILQGGNYSGTGPLTSGFSAASSAPVPPNMALDQGVKLSNGKIIYGSDVTSIKREDCPEPISRTKLKESLIKNRLK